MAEGHPPAAAMASYRRSRLPFARPQTLQTLQTSAQLRREKVPQQAQHSPLLATPNAAGKSHHKATAMAQEHPTAAAMAYFIGVQGCRLRGLKPSKPSTSSKSLPNSAGKRYPNPQSHSNGSRAPRGRSNGFFWAFNAAVCEASNPPNASNASKALATPNSARKRYPNRHHAQRCKQKPPQQVPDKATAMAQSRLLIMGRVHLAAGCNFSLLEKQKAICLSCCPSSSLSLQYPPSN